MINTNRDEVSVQCIFFYDELPNTQATNNQLVNVQSAKLTTFDDEPADAQATDRQGADGQCPNRPGGKRHGADGQRLARFPGQTLWHFASLHHSPPQQTERSAKYTLN